MKPQTPHRFAITRAMNTPDTRAWHRRYDEPADEIRPDETRLVARHTTLTEWPQLAVSLFYGSDVMEWDTIDEARKHLKELARIYETPENQQVAFMVPASGNGHAMMLHADGIDLSIVEADDYRRAMYEYGAFGETRAVPIMLDGQEAFHVPVQFECAPAKSDAEAAIAASTITRPCGLTRILLPNGEAFLLEMDTTGVGIRNAVTNHAVCWCKTIEEAVHTLLCGRVFALDSEAFLLNARVPQIEFANRWAMLRHAREVTSNLKRFYGTFGHGQPHFGKYVMMVKEHQIDAQRAMTRRFGDKWSHVYDETGWMTDDGTTQDVRWNLKRSVIWMLEPSK